MTSWYSVLLILIAAPGSNVLAEDQPGDAPGEPRITAQGFSIDTPLVNEPRGFSSTRVRIEASARIAKLLVSEGEFETDLANTQDRSLFAQFGLRQRPLHAYDVTLDLASFMNERLTAPATYRITVTAVDRDGAMATAALTATVVASGNTAVDAGQQEPAPKLLRESVVTLTRQGAGRVDPPGEAPLTWVTREAMNVTIRLRSAQRDGDLRQLDPASWETTLTRESLARQISALPAVPYVDVPAARNAAAGTVLAVGGNDGIALIRVTSSASSLSPLGTTVTLTALVRD